MSDIQALRILLKILPSHHVVETREPEIILRFGA